MILDATTKKIQVLLAATVATTQLPIVTNWVDMTALLTTPGSTTNASNNTTAVDVIAAPAASTQRLVQSISIYNVDTANATVTVQYNDNATIRIIVKIILLPGQSLCYSAQNGWIIPGGTLFGGNKGSFRANKNNVDQTAIATATTTKLTFTTEVFDTGNYYDSTNSKWTPPAGSVLLNASVWYSAGAVVGSSAQIQIYKNGAQLGSATQIAGSVSEVIPEATIIDTANGTDYYEIYAYAAGAGNKTASGTVGLTWFCGTCL